MTQRAVIVGYVRSPFTPAKRGELATVRPDDMLAQVMKGLIDQTGVDASKIEDVLVGCAFPEGEQGFNVARLSSFLAGLPITAGAATVNRFCGSSMEAIHIAAGKIAIGAGDAFICGGIENMTRVPMLGFNPIPNPTLAKTYPEAMMGMVETADVVAGRCNVARPDQEAFAVQSHFKANAAQAAGKLTKEIIPITGRGGVISKDGCIRPDTTAETLAALKPVAGGVVTAGTSSPLTDGASAVLVVSEDFAKANNLPILAYIKTCAVAGLAPEVMGLGPVPAIRKALDRAGITVADVDVFEINEAFASQALACVRELGIDPAKVNLDGGALALGHPLGATGARITGKAAQLLAREGGRYAVSAQCIGGGQGIATVLERPDSEGRNVGPTWNYVEPKPENPA